MVTRLIFTVMLWSLAAAGQQINQAGCVLSSLKEGTKVTLHGNVDQGPHDMTLNVSGCGDAVVLVYAGDPEAGPSISPPHRDKGLKEFEKYTAATYKGTGKSICVECSKYEVEATLSGRFDVATIPEGFKKDNLGFLHDESGKVTGKVGFGHPIPIFKYRLVIESASDVVARKRR